MLFLYCGGAIAAPILASTLMAQFGVEALFVQNAVTHAALAVFALWRTFARVSAAPLARTPSLREIRPGRG